MPADVAESADAADLMRDVVAALRDDELTHDKAFSLLTRLDALEQHATAELVGQLAACDVWDVWEELKQLDVATASTPAQLLYPEPSASSGAVTSTIVSSSSLAFAVASTASSMERRRRRRLMSRIDEGHNVSIARASSSVNRNAACTACDATRHDGC